MVVKMVTFPSLVHCQWFSANRLQEGIFAPESLDFAQAPKPREAQHADFA